MLDGDFIKSHTTGLRNVRSEGPRDVLGSRSRRSPGFRAQRSKAPRTSMSRRNASSASTAWALPNTSMGSRTSAMLLNLLLLKGNIGREGAGYPRSAATRTCRVSGPSASREKPELVPLDKYRRAVRLRAASRRGAEHREDLRRHSRRRGPCVHRTRRQSSSARSPNGRRWRRLGRACASPSRSRRSSTAVT